MDPFEGHLAFCRTYNWRSIYRPIYEQAAAVSVPRPPVGYPQPSGAFFVDVSLRDAEAPDLPPPVSELIAFRGKRSLETGTWEENLASQRVAALRKWSGILLTNLPCFTLGRQLSKDGPLGPSLGESLKHTFANKATGTLRNRVVPLLRFLAWCKRCELQALPVREEVAYKFMTEVSSSSSPTFLRSFVVSLSFAWHMLGLNGALDAVSSKRICGLAQQEFLRKRKTRPRDPLSVDMVATLEHFVSDLRAAARDRTAAGCFLLPLLASSIF